MDATSPRSAGGIDSGTAASVSINSADSVLPAGSYTLRDLVGRRGAMMLPVGADGHIRGYVPGTVIAPRESLVLELIRR